MGVSRVGCESHPQDTDKSGETDDGGGNGGMALWPSNQTAVASLIADVPAASLGLALGLLGCRRVLAEVRCLCDDAFIGWSSYVIRTPGTAQPS